MNWARPGLHHFDGGSGAAVAERISDPENGILKMPEPKDGPSSQTPSEPHSAILVIACAAMPSARSQSQLWRGAGYYPGLAAQACRQASSMTRRPVAARARPRITREVEENCDWDYDRIAGGLANLGHKICDQTIGNVLQRNATVRRRHLNASAWSIKAHLSMDFLKNHQPRSTTP